jgi:uncharacterized membrane protein
VNPADHSPARIQSVDALRGAIMIIMAIDHIRDFVHNGAMSFSPTDLTRTTTAIFLTRWITHFCAPVFMFTAGIGAYLWMQRGGHTKSELSRFLLTRGLWLILLETTILRVVMFSEIHYRGSIVILLILWALGMSMIFLAALAHLPVRFLVPLSIAVIATHNLLDPIKPASFGRAAWLWDIFHQQALFTFFGVSFVTAYPVLPWIFVMAAGYCAGHMFLWESARRQRFLLRLGLALTVAFVLLRAINIYGDPSRWSHQSSALFTVLSFLNTTKYPPSLAFLLMTLGPAMVALSQLDRLRFSSSNPVIVFGRVPFFFYAAHLFVIHAGTIALNFLRYGRAPFLLLAAPSMGGPAKAFPPDYGFNLWVVYAFWVATLSVLYPACLWFSRLKQRRHDWWLSYL